MSAKPTLDSTMEQILSTFPSAKRVLFQRYHIGGCGTCGYDGAEKLGDVLKRKDIADAQGVLDAIVESAEAEKKLIVTVAQTREAMAAGAKLIDVRSPQEREGFGSIEGDAFLLDQEKVQDMMDNWDKKTPIVFYCQQGFRSLDAATWFIGHGFSEVKSLEGGFMAWEQAQVEADAAKIAA